MKSVYIRIKVCNIFCLFFSTIISAELLAEDLYPQGALVDGLYYSPGGSIIVDGNLCRVTPGTDVTFIADREIILKDEFHAQAGSTFHARINDQLDTDGDGVPDWWELFYGLDPVDPQDADGDLDGDGFTNLEEFLGGTDPTEHELPVVTFSAHPLTIVQGQSSRLTWTTANATQISILPGLTAPALEGSTQVSPANTTTYILSATGPGGSTTESVTVTVIPDPTLLSFEVYPETVIEGATTTLSWDVGHADTVTIEPGIGAVPIAGEREVTPAQTKTYTLTAVQSSYTLTKTVHVTVLHPVPQVSLRASPIDVLPGQSTTLTWTSERAQTASIDQGVGQVDLAGSLSVVPDGTRVYTITVSGLGGQASTSVIVGNFTDEDNDTLPDAWEIYYFGTIEQWGPDDDPDGDLLTNLMEYNKETHPRRYNPEDVYLKCPLQNGAYHSGGRIIVPENCAIEEGLSIELKANCDILIQPDFYLPVGSEVSVIPGDCDWLPDDWERLMFGTLEYGTDDDPDGDGLTNYWEYVIQSDPTVFDKDNDDDGLEDQWELENIDDLSQDGTDDCDLDGISNYVEYITGSHPCDWESQSQPGTYYEYDAVGRIKRVIKIK